MRSTAHSAIAGAAAALLLIVSLGAAGPRGEDLMRVAGIPAPEDLVRVDEGEVFEVTDGNTLVICGVASGGVTSVVDLQNVSFQVNVNGEAVLSGGLSATFGLTSSSVNYSPGFAVKGPASVSILNVTKRFPTGQGTNFSTDFEPVLHGYVAPSR